MPKKNKKLFHIHEKIRTNTDDELLDMIQEIIDTARANGVSMPFINVKGSDGKVREIDLSDPDWREKFKSTIKGDS